MAKEWLEILPFSLASIYSITTVEFLDLIDLVYSVRTQIYYHIPDLSRNSTLHAMYLNLQI